MTTEAAVAVETTSQPNPAAFEPVISETKTDAEREYFKSRGEKSDGLFTKPSEPTKTVETKAPETTKTTEKPAGDELDDGEIIVEADGVARNQKTGRFVPKSAFLRVKGELQTRNTEAQKLREDLIQTRERLNILTEVLPDTKTAETTKPADAEPDPKEDLLGWVEWAKKQLADLSGKANKSAEDISRDRERASLQNFFTSDVAKFQQTNADFLDALNHGIGVRHKMLEAVGVKDEAQRQRMVLEEINNLIKETAAERKTNPSASVAAKLYEAAKALGYTKKAPEPKKDDNTAALDEIARLSEAQKASQTLGKGGSSAVGEAITREKLATMGDSDYSNARTAYIAKHGRQAWNDFLAGKR